MQFLGSLFQNSAAIAGTTANYSYTYTQDPSPGVLIAVVTTIGNLPTSITFDGQAMTQVISYNGAAQAFAIWKYIPSASKASGSYTVGVTMPGSGITLDIWIGEYNGILNDFTNAAGATVAFTASPIAFPLTTVANDSWVFVFGRFTSFARSANGSSDGTLRSPTGFSRAWVDSGAAEGSAGSKSINITSGSSPLGNFEYIVLELKRETVYTLNLTETATATEIKARNETRPVLDTQTFTDRKTPALTRFLLDTVAFLDSVVAQASKIFSEVVTVTDVIHRLMTRSARDTVTAVDRITRSMTVRFADVSHFTDSNTLSGVWIPRTLPTTSWGDVSSPSSPSWSERTDPTTSWSERTPPSDTWTGRTPPSTSWS